MLPQPIGKFSWAVLYTNHWIHETLPPTLDKMLEVEFWSQIFFSTLKLLVQNEYFSPEILHYFIFSLEAHVSAHFTALLH